MTGQWTHVSSADHGRDDASPVLDRAFHVWEGEALKVVAVAPAKRSVRVCGVRAR